MDLTITNCKTPAVSMATICRWTGDNTVLYIGFCSCEFIFTFTLTTNTVPASYTPAINDNVY